TFGNLNAGNYSVRVVAATLPAGLAPTFDLDGIGTANTASFALAAGQTRTDVDFGYQQPPANGSLGDRVWNDLDNDGVQDGGENGINGITVQLLNAGGTVIATQVTAGDGNYNFTGLAAGTYSVRVVAATIPVGFFPTYDLDGLGTLNIATVTLANGQNRTDVDFGYWCPPGKGSIGDRVWNDLDADGVQDAGEPGLNGVTVELLDATGAVLATQVTAGNGNYLFPNLATGNYSVRVVTATLPAGFAATFDLDGIATLNITAVFLGDGQNRTDVDFGYANAAICVGGGSQILHPPSGGIIPWPFGPGIVASADLYLEIVPDPAGDYARFRIVNTSQNLPENGEDSGPDAISFNLPYSLTAANITVLAPSTFKELRDGTTPGDIFGEFAWEVRRNEHNDTPFVFELRVPGVDLTEAAFGYNAQGQRFIMRINGIFYNGENENRAFSGCVPSKLGSIGDRVWEDYDSDGIQDAGEPGLNGITVRLKDALGNVLATQVTAGNGNYLFENLVASPYTVEVVAATVPGGLFPTYDRDGVATPHVATVSLSEGQSRTDVDFGYNKVKLGSIGDRVWYDNDADGVQDAGEGGINGVTVQLKNSGGTVIATQVTSGNGNYLFTDLLAGTYTVEINSATLPGGLVQTYDLDGTGTAHQATTTLTEGQDRTNVDFGYAKVVGGSIGDRVWFDIDRDAVQDAGEPGWNGRTVRLRSGGATGTILQTQVTSGDGNYLFINLGAGTYTVEVVVTGVADLVRTYDRDGTSTANRATVTLAANQNRTDVDFGYAIKVKPILECVIDNKDDTFTAYFGYQNSMTAAVPIAVGSRNKFSPNPTNRNQPTVFQPGRTPFWPSAAFSVTASDWQTLVWTLDGKTATATDKSTPCSYHVFFEKEWVDADGNVSTVPPASIAPDFEIYAESQIGKVHCYYPKDSTKLICEYWNQQPPALDNNGLWVPVGTEYWVTEKNLPAGWNPTGGVGTFPMPNGECVPGRDGFEKYCTHTVTNSQVPSLCADAALYDPTWGQFFGNHAIWLPEIATDLVFDPRGRLYEFDNGSARLTGVVRSLSDPKLAFEVDLTFTGKTTTGTPHKELKPAAYIENGGPVDPATWYYYADWEGSLIGIDDMAGADVWIYSDLAFQIGFGASGKNVRYGGSGWLGWDVKSQPKNGTKLPTKGKGDINIDIKDCPPVILAPIPN
ncbi:MAG: SdrD B-like domain-containing protein, partial [Thermoanaerobaculia bacterium]|nr:SdrD B-like domain-containing protein [Thermoanaerobaculia bacterium]